MIKWDDGIGSRGRAAWLLLVKGDEVRTFDGLSMPGWVAVIGSDYRKAGKWSSTTYRLETAPGVRTLSGRAGWDRGTFAEGLCSCADRGGREDGDGPRVERIDTWRDMANALRVTIPSAQRFLRAWKPKAAEILDAVETALADVDDAAPEGVSEIVISFGSPTRRLRDEGFWEWPVVVRRKATSEEALAWVAADPDPSYMYGQPLGRKVEDCPGVEIGRGVPDGDAQGGYRFQGERTVRMLTCERSSGHGGGYVSMRIVAPVGASVSHAKTDVAAQSDMLTVNK